MDILDRFIMQAQKSLEGGYYEDTRLLEKTSALQTARKASLRRRLIENDFTLIAEVKHASPAGEYYLEDIDVRKATLEFKNAGADAISVVVEPTIFKGKLENVTIAKKTGLPVLFKDFVLSGNQIKSAALLEADCILLIVKVAERLGLNLDNLIKIAHTYGLEVLLECYDEREMEKALKTDADIIGVNNRDLQTLNVNLNRTKEIMEAVRSKIDRPVISESGIKTRDDARLVKAAGVKGVLVGTAIWKSESPVEKIRELKQA